MCVVPIYVYLCLIKLACTGDATYYKIFYVSFTVFLKVAIMHHSVFR